MLTFNELRILLRQYISISKPSEQKKVKTILDGFFNWLKKEKGLDEDK